VDSDTAWVVQSAHQILFFHGGSATLGPERLGTMLLIARRADDPRLLERVLSSLASEAESTGDYPGALSHRLEILGMAETHPEVRHNLPSALTNVGYAYQIAGELQTAEAHLQRSAACSAEMGLWTSHALARCNLAEVALLRDRHKEARDQALTALRVAPPGWGLRAATMSMLARAHAALNDREAALATGREALREYPTSPDPFDRAELELLLATLPELRVATRPGDPAHAR
jgi:tetratricopeptide (TPR) repeat protein